MAKAIPVSKELVKSYDKFFFIWGYISPLNIWPEIIQPSKPATFATAFQPCKAIYEHMSTRKKKG